jgi:hypothetical protein
MMQAAMVMGPINNMPRARDAGRDQTAKELQKLAQDAKALALHIRAIHSPALRAIEAQKPKISPLLLADSLASLSGTAFLAIDHLSPTMEAVRKGRYPNERALTLATTARDTYEWYTGKRASIATDPNSNKRVSEFFKFVKAIFKVARVEANPEYFAGFVVRQKKQA